MRIKSATYALTPIVTVDVEWQDGLGWQVTSIELDWAGSGAYNTGILREADGTEHLVEQDGSHPILDAQIGALVDTLDLPTTLDIHHKRGQS